MAWMDLLSFLAITLFLIGSILGVLSVAKFISSCIQSMKTLLEQRGIIISRDGVIFKSLKRLDRDAYVDATQRGLGSRHGHGRI